MFEQAAARTSNFLAGDNAVFPDNTGHYFEDTSTSEGIYRIETYKSDRVVDIWLTQYLALMPPRIVVSAYNNTLEAAKGLKEEKQLIFACCKSRKSFE